MKKIILCGQKLPFYEVGMIISAQEIKDNNLIDDNGLIVENLHNFINNAIFVEDFDNCLAEIPGFFTSVIFKENVLYALFVAPGENGESVLSCLEFNKKRIISSEKDKIKKTFYEVAVEMMSDFIKDAIDEKFKSLILETEDYDDYELPDAEELDDKDEFSEECCYECENYNHCYNIDDDDEEWDDENCKNCDGCINQLCEDFDKCQGKFCEKKSSILDGAVGVKLTENGPVVAEIEIKDIIDIFKNNNDTYQPTPVPKSNYHVFETTNAEAVVNAIVVLGYLHKCEDDIEIYAKLGKNKQYILVKNNENLGKHATYLIEHGFKQVNYVREFLQEHFDRIY